MSRATGKVWIEQSSAGASGLLIAGTAAAVAKEQGSQHPEGIARCHGHHGELFQGQIEHPDGTRRRCLVTLPCPAFYSEVCVRLNDSGTVTVCPGHKLKSRNAVALALAHLDAAGFGAHVIVTNNIEEGKGYGSSTADCVAAVRAAARALGRRLSDREVARIVVASETASDNTMFSQTVLFAQREGIVVEDYGRLFPRLAVVGADTAPCDKVDTLVYPPAQYGWRHLHTFATLIGALRRAMRTEDLDLLGRIATASSIINDNFLPKPVLPELLRLSRAFGALGVSVAHSGTVAGILLDSRKPHWRHQVDSLTSELAYLGLRKSVCFTTQ